MEILGHTWGKVSAEAKPMDTNGRVVLFPLSILGRKHILMARSIAEGPNFKVIYFSSSTLAYKWIIGISFNSLGNIGCSFNNNIL